MADKIVKIKVPENVSDRHVKFIVAAELYREGKLSLCEAACIAEMDLWSFLYEVGRKKISFQKIDFERFKRKFI